MEVDFLAFLKRTSGKFAFVATYEFDPQFFERRILQTRAFEGAMVTVFLDRHRYSELIASDRLSDGFDRDYFVIPIDRGDGVFHPKLYLSVGDKGAIASVGSNNCTASGTGHNHELISTFEAVGDGTASLETEMVKAVFHVFRRYVNDAGGLKDWLQKAVFGEAIAAYPWLTSPRDESANGEVELLSSHENPLMPQVISRLASTNVSEITMMAPFFGKDLEIIKRLRSLWPKAKIRILTQSGYSNLPVDHLQQLRAEGVPIDLFTAVSEKSGRNLHAKALAFKSGRGTHWLAGSANMSHRALYGKSSETCLWFKTEQDVEKALEAEQLSWKKIEPSAFEVAPIEEPEPPDSRSDNLRLGLLILKENGDLVVTGQVAEGIRDLRLRLTRRREKFPALSKLVDLRSEQFTIALTQDELANFDRPVAGQLTASHAGRNIESNPCSVSQLARLLRERGSGGASGNRLARITESGDGLIEYVDTLEGVNAAIDFMNNTNIRFHDGGGNFGGASSKWRARDPFSTDVPTHWELGSTGGAIEDLREAIWGFVQRHVNTRLERHAKRGSLGGLDNFLDIFRAINRLLFTWHHRTMEGAAVIPCPYLTQGVQEGLTTLLGERDANEIENRGFGQALMRNLSGDRDLVRNELMRHNVPAIVAAANQQMIMARAVYLGSSGADDWSKKRQQWVSGWLEQMRLDQPTRSLVHETCLEFSQVA